MPMKRTENHSQGDIAINTLDIALPDGKVRNRKEIRGDLIDTFMKRENFTMDEAKKKIDRLMSKIPSWKRKEARMVIGESFFSWRQAH